jgi:uncharacterized protein (TIGR02118 family)
VLYPNRDDVKFDFDYYMTKHIPMVARLLDTTIEVSKGIATPAGTAVPFLYTARIRVNSLEQYEAAMARHGAQIIGDIPNYCNAQPTVQIDEVL